MGWKISDLALFSRREVCDPGPQLEQDAPLEPPGELDTPSSANSEEVAISVCWERINRVTRSSSSGPLPGSYDPTLRTLEAFLERGAYKVKIKKGIRKKDLFRFLLAKMLYEREEGLHIDEFLVLWELYLNLLELLQKDPSFKEKYGKFFENSSVFFRMLGDQREFPIRIEETESCQYLERIVSVLEPMLPTRSAYFGLKGQKDLRSGFSLVFASEILSRRAPECRRIGVGYRDKGSRRDPALDGSPDWREVASSLQEERIRYVESLLNMVREHPEFDWDLVYNQERPDCIDEEEIPPNPPDCKPL